MSEDTKEIVTMDNLKSKITDRIKSSFVDLVPEEAWKIMVEKEVDHFINPQKDRYGSQNSKASPLEGLIQAEIEDRFKRYIKTELDKPEYSTWFSDGETPPSFIKAVIEKAAPALISIMFGRVVEDAVMRIKNNM